MTAPRLVKAVFADPVVAREARARTRSPATTIGIVICVAVVTGIALTMFSRAVLAAPEQPTAAARMATVAYHTMALQLATVVLLAPSMAGRAIAGERERATLELLLLAGLTPWAIVRAKLVASVSYVMLFVVAVAPVYVAVFLHTGVGLGGLALAELVTFTTALTGVSLGILLSALCSRSFIATLAAAGLGLALCLDVVLAGVVPAPGAGLGPTGQPPLAAAASATVHPVRWANPLYALHQLVTGPEAADPPGELPTGGTNERTSGPLIKPWQLSVVVQLALAALLLAVAVRFVAPQAESAGALRRGRKLRPAR